jgi:hypothetical protein
MKNNLECLVETQELYKQRATFFANQWGPSCDEAKAYDQLAEDLNEAILDLMIESQEQRVRLSIVA